MSIIVYPKNFSGMYEIANATAVQMSYYYNGIGTLILDVPINDENVAALKVDNIVYDTVKKISYIIKNVKTNQKQNRITANGFTTNQILNSRVIADYVAIGNIESDIYYAVSENLRDLSNVYLVGEEKGLTETAEEDTALYGGSVLDEIMPILSAAGLGQRMTWDYRSKRHIFEIYKGTDRTTGLDAIVFSDDRGTAWDFVVNDDASEFKNAAYVTATLKGEDDEEIVLLVSVGTARGNDRHEMWLEFNDSLKKDEDGNYETQSQFRVRMQRYGNEELAKYLRKYTFSVVVDPSELGKEYNVGDLVACVSKRFGLRFVARVSGVKYKKDSTTDSTEIVLGEPVLLGEE